MNELAKIKEVSSRYNVTTRTLRYYEKMGLIKSSRCESLGYRLYDETALGKDNAFIESLFDTSDVVDEGLTSVELSGRFCETEQAEPAKLQSGGMEACRFIGKTMYASAIFDYDTTKCPT